MLHVLMLREKTDGVDFATMSGRGTVYMLVDTAVSGNHETDAILTCHGRTSQNVEEGKGTLVWPCVGQAGVSLTRHVGVQHRMQPCSAG